MKTINPESHRNGFALVITLSLMILLTLIAVGLLSLVRRLACAPPARARRWPTARANARLALMLAHWAICRNRWARTGRSPPPPKSLRQRDPCQTQHHRRLGIVVGFQPEWRLAELQRRENEPFPALAGFQCRSRGTRVAGFRHRHMDRQNHRACRRRLARGQATASRQGDGRSGAGFARTAKSKVPMRGMSPTNR